uniref:Uncharacterized protein n=1 Tax=Anguilla anguilla TaxID=7936 RepID=A0A0E9U0J8_ANGAN
MIGVSRRLAGFFTQLVFCFLNII